MQSETQDQDSTGAHTSIDTMSDASEETARLSKAKAEIKRLFSLPGGFSLAKAEIKRLYSLPDGFSVRALSKEVSAIKDKEDIPENVRKWLTLTTLIETLVKERGEKLEILEKKRVQDTIQEWLGEIENMDGWSSTESASLDNCPICLETPLSDPRNGNFFNRTYPCCGKMICTSCFRELERRSFLRDECNSCPMCRQDFPKSDEEYDKLIDIRADDGIPWAQFKVGLRFEYAGDLQSALQWYKLAAEQGDANALCSLGLFHEEGLGELPQSNTEAKQYYRASAKRGHPHAQFFLGDILAEESQGPEGQQGEAMEAVRLFTLSAAQGFDCPCVALGHMHNDGYGGLEKSLELALYWYLKAARSGYDQAQYEVANSLLEIASERYGAYDITGFSAVPKALYWYRKAADQGHEKANQRVGQLVRSVKGKGCGGCGKSFGPDDGTRTCARCKGVYYCSEECQQTDWKGWHKKDCVDHAPTRT